MNLISILGILFFPWKFHYIEKQDNCIYIIYVNLTVISVGTMIARFSKTSIRILYSTFNWEINTDVSNKARLIRLS